MLARVPDDAPPPRQFKFKPKEFERVNPARGEAAPSADHDVYAIRQELRAKEQAAGLDELAPKVVQSRRKKDFLFLLASLVAFFGVIAFLGRGNPFVLVCALAGLGFSICGLSWVMWQVMGRY